MDSINDVSLIGPAFIGALAERQLQAGLETDYKGLQLNAQAWSQDRQRIDQLERDNATLQDRLDTIRAAAQRAA